MSPKEIDHKSLKNDDPDDILLDAIGRGIENDSDEDWDGNN